MTRQAIRPLDPDVIGKIAAGEVVERPAYALKELIENSIDAGATAITVEMRDGGLTYFRVTDNGCGIAPEDIRLAFERHATSKLHTARELEAVQTLGFRGEALASIAAVAKVEMTTRAMGQENGIKAIVHGGVIESIQVAASPEGTTIAVHDLFYNTPARRKFLKKPATEAGLVSDLVMRLILARPDIAFRLTHAQRQIYRSSGNGNLRDALFSVLGKDALTSLVEIKGSASGCHIHGFVGVGEAARGSRAMQTFILNGRYVRNTFLSQALEEGCRERVMIGKHPVCALHLTMPYERVDVNVHPNKLEVRFVDERALMAGLSAVVHAAFEPEPFRAAPALLLEDDPKEAIRLRAVEPSLSKEASMPLMNHSVIRVRDSASAPPMIPAVPPENGRRLENVSDALSELYTHTIEQQMEIMQPSQTQMHLKPIEILGVAWYEYVFALQEERLYIIDQHAAHERILYERYNKALDQQVASQQLLVPQVVQLTHREHAAILASMDDLHAAGFEIEPFGDRTIQVRAVPMILGAPQLKSFFGELADRLGEYKTLPTQELRRDILVKFACRKAVKAGDPLSRESIEHLLREMRESNTPPTCPHGRPLVVMIEKSELDKRFRRIT